MTAEPAAPGAGAVYLYREEIDDDFQQVHNFYVRMKILTEAGKSYADVEIPYSQSVAVVSVEARTIHADGKIIVFSGKPYDRLQQGSTARYREVVFSMPDVEVGSILEYKYQQRYYGSVLAPPVWFLQKDLYVTKAHYQFLPYDGPMTATAGGFDAKVSTLRWYPILPPGAEVLRVKKQHSWSEGPAISYVLDLEHISPVPDEDYLPPIHSLVYRVYFQYSPYQSGEEFWSKEGKHWSKEADRFIGPGARVKALVAGLAASSDSADAKLRKFYAEVISYENTDFTRERSRREEKAEGLHEVRTADDVIARKRGSGDELTMLFIAMARAAGMPAYVMQVTSREREIFNPNVLTMAQLDSMIAIVNVAGKDQYFDPGERYCTYGLLRWDHTMTSGIRQTSGDTAFAQTPQATYTDSKVVRVARLSMNDAGQIDGTVEVSSTGDPALAWRQRALTEDHVEVEKLLEEAMQKVLPTSLTAKLDKVNALDDPSKELVAVFHIQGQLGQVTSKRIFVPLEIFEVKEKPKFLQPKRMLPVFFDYAYQEFDQVTVTYPASMRVESIPKMESAKLQQLAMFKEGSVMKDNAVTLVRNFALGTTLFKVDEYEGLRSFFSTIANKDSEQAIFTVTKPINGN